MFEDFNNRIDDIVQYWDNQDKTPEREHIQKALEHCRTSIVQKELNIKQFIMAIRDKIETSDCKSFSEVKKIVLQKIETDLRLIQKLNSAIKDSDVQTTYVLNSNKIETILNYTQSFIENKFEAFYELITEDKQIEGYDFTAIPLVLLDDSSQASVYSNIKQVILTAALSYTFLAHYQLNYLSDIKIQIQHDDIKRTLPWFDVSPLAHTTFIPEEIIAKCPEFKLSTFYFEQYDAEQAQGFDFIHGGYGFGGGRTESRYIADKAHKPFDCSSFISCCIGADPQHTTTTSLHNYFIRESDQKAIKTIELARFSNHLEAKLQDPKDPQRDIKPGMLWVNKGLKGGGHTGFTINPVIRSSDTQLITLGCNRGLPQNTQEGVGLEIPSLFSPEGRTYCFFDVVNPQPNFPDFEKNSAQDYSLVTHFNR